MMKFGKVEKDGSILSNAVLLLLALFPELLCGQVDPSELLRQARAKIAGDIEKLPKYTCVQTVHRSRFELFPRSSIRDCRVGEPGRPEPLLAWRDRFKLDVTVSGDSEIFSWAGARQFETGDAQQIVGGGLTGTGDFGPFMADIFGSRPAECQYLGLEREQDRDYAVYSYRVPVAASGYNMKVGPQADDLTTLAYEGKFWIDPRNAELHRITIVVPQPPPASETCRIETTIDYRQVPLGASRLLLPQLTLLKLWDNDGTRYENRVEYAACRAFQSESVFRPETDSPPPGSSAPQPPPGALPAIPPGITLRIALSSTIDPSTAYAGDAVEGRLLRAIRRDGQTLAPAGAAVHGRIVRLEQRVLPSKYVALGLKFDSLAVNGGEIPLKLEAIPRSREERDLASPRERRRGVGMLRLSPGRLVTEWKTR